MGSPFRGPAPSTDDQGGILGAILDWGARLTNGLSAANPAMAASKSVPGIVTLASATQALAGTDDLFAMTAADALAAREARRYATLTALAAAASTARDGAIAVVPEFTTTNGKVFSSTWRFQATGTNWIPLAPLKCLNAATLTDLKALLVTGLNFDPRFTNAFVIRDGATPANGWDEYIWIGATTGFLLWRGTTGVTYSSGVSTRGGGQSPLLQVDAEWTDVSLHCTASAGFAINAAVANITNTQARPPADSFIPIWQANGSGWTAGGVFINTAGDIKLLTTAQTSGQDFGIQGRFRRGIPTV